MNSTGKGQIAQLKAELRAAEKGLTVSKPTADCRYDLVVDNNGLHRVQVKYGDAVSSNTPNAVVVNLSKTTRAGTTFFYTAEEIDAVVAYLPRVDEVIWIPIARCENKSKLQIRVAGGRRATGIWYEDYIW